MSALPTVFPHADRAMHAANAQLRYVISRKWRLLATALTVTLLAALWCFAQTPMYLARTTILLEQAPIHGLSGDNPYDPAFATGEYLATQVEIINSRQTAEKVVDRLNLVDSPEFASIRATKPRPNTLHTLLRWLPFLPKPPEDSATPGATAAAVPAEPPGTADAVCTGNAAADPAAAVGTADLPDATDRRRDRIVSVVLARLSVDPIPRTQLIRIGYSASSPVVAATIANAFADVYVESGLEARLEKSKKTAQWLNSKLTDIRDALAKSEKALQDYRERERIVTVGGDRGLVESDVIENTRRLRDAEKSRTELASLYQKIEEIGSDYTRLEDLSDLLAAPQVQNARLNFLQAQDALKELTSRYGEKHPQIAVATAKAEAAERTYIDQLRIAAQGVKTQYEMARQNERVLQGSVASAKARVTSLEGKEYELRILERDVESNKQLYDTFLSSFKQTDAASSSDEISVRVLERAKGPSAPYRPATQAVVPVAFVVGLMLAVLLLLLQRQLSDVVDSAETLAEASGLRVITTVPIEKALGKPQNLVRLFGPDATTPFVDSLRSLHTFLRFSDPGHQYRRILLTSSTPSEGKTSLAVALALSFAQNESTVLLEADLRQPVMKKVFGIGKEVPGLMTLIEQADQPLPELYREPTTGLSVIPVDRSPASPAQIVDSKAFVLLLDQLAARYDRVIIDSAPHLLASESLVLARMADAVLLVCAAQATSRLAVRQSVEQLQQIGANLIGYVLNKTRRQRGRYYDAYYGRRRRA